MIIGENDMKDFRKAKKRVDVTIGESIKNYIIAEPKKSLIMTYKRH